MSEETKCDECGSTDQVRVIRPRHGMGRSASYGAKRNWCAGCCRRNRGAYQLYSNQRLKPKALKEG